VPVSLQVLADALPGVGHVIEHDAMRFIRGPERHLSALLGVGLAFLDGEGFPVGHPRENDLRRLGFRLRASGAWDRSSPLPSFGRAGLAHGRFRQRGALVW